MILMYSNFWEATRCAKHGLKLCNVSQCGKLYLNINGARCYQRIHYCLQHPTVWDGVLLQVNIISEIYDLACFNSNAYGQIHCAISKIKVKGIIAISESCSVRLWLLKYSQK